MKGFEHSPKMEDDMLIVRDLLLEVNELLPSERKKGSSVEDVIGMVLDRHQVSDKKERLKLSAAITLAHIEQSVMRARIARADKRHEPWREREKRQGLI